MADHALKAKQKAAERALKRVDVLQQQGAMEKKLLKRVRAASSRSSFLQVSLGYLKPIFCSLYSASALIMRPLSHLGVPPLLCRLLRVGVYVQCLTCNCMVTG